MPYKYIAGTTGNSSRDDNADYETSQILADELNGRVCKVEITDKYTILDGLFNTRLVLNRSNDIYDHLPTDTTYYVEKTINNKLTKVTLTDHTNRKIPELAIRVEIITYPTDSVWRYAGARWELQKLKN